MTLAGTGDAEGFIRANTAIHAPPHVPEIRLHLADEAFALWRRTEEELAAIGLPLPFWAFAWAGGQGLARYLLDNPPAVAGRTVLDFACGCGLVAIAAARAGARSIAAADTDSFCAAAVRLNAALNGVEIDFRHGDPVGTFGDWDMVLAGDVYFDRDLARQVTPWLEELARRGCRVLIGDPGRAYLPRQGLREIAAYDVPVTRALEDAEVKHTRVFEMLPA